MHSSVCGMSAHIRQKMHQRQTKSDSDVTHTAVTSPEVFVVMKLFLCLIGSSTSGRKSSLHL